MSCYVRLMFRLAEMARHQTSFMLCHLRLLLSAAFSCVGTAGVEPAPGGRRDGAGDIALQHLQFILRLNARTQDSTEQRLRIGMLWLLENLFGIPVFHQLAQIHDGDNAAHLIDHT